MNAYQTLPGYPYSHLPRPPTHLRPGYTGASFVQWKHYFYQEASAGSVHRILSRMEEWPGGHGQSNLAAFVRIHVLCPGEEVQPALMTLGGG